MESIRVGELELDLDGPKPVAMCFSCPCCSGSWPAFQLEPCAWRERPEEPRLPGQSAGRDAGVWWRALGYALCGGDGSHGGFQRDGGMNAQRAWNPWPCTQWTVAVTQGKSLLVFLLLR